MGKDENLKRQKLRNNEYYNFQKIQDELYAKSQKGTTFKSLMNIITSDENIMLAYRNIKKNRGSKTKGTDGKTIEHLAKMTPDELIELIRRKLRHYQPQKIRRVEIPKEDGKKRPLGIPTITDRLIQQCILQVLEPICEAKFYKHSYGFRPLRGTKHALARAYYLAQKVDLHYVIDIDIKGFFDNIDHGKLLKQIWTQGTQDKQLLCIISKLLKTEVQGIGKTEKGTPQGGIISPLLANITLNELDWWISKQWENIPTERNYLGNKKNPKGYKAQSLKSKTSLKEVYIVRYADDFKLFCRDMKSAKRMYIAVKQWLWERLRLETNEEKSGIVNLQNRYSEFLGIKFKVHPKGKSSKGKNKLVVKSYIGDKAKHKILNTIKEHAKCMQKPKDHNPYKAVNAYNAYILGIHNYFNSATHCNLDFNKIAFQSRAILKNRLKPRRRKAQETIPKHITERYGKSEQIRFIHNIAAIPIGYVQHQRLMNYNGLTPYKTEDRAKIHNKQQAVNANVLKYLMLNPIQGRSIEYNDNRISLFVGQYGKCHILEIEIELDEIHCHHKKPTWQGGTDEYGNLVILHKEIHRLLHAIEAETIQQYLNRLNLSAEQLHRLNKLRKLAELPIIKVV